MPRGTHHAQSARRGPSPKRRRSRQSPRLPDHQLNDRELGGGPGPDRLRPAGDAEDEARPGRRPELPGVARRWPRWLPRRCDRPPPGAADVLVLRDRLHLRRWLDLLGAPGGRTGRDLEGAFRAEGRDRRRDESGDGGGVLRLGLAGERLHPLPARLAQLPPLRERLRGREHAGDDVDLGSRALLAVADPLLPPGALGGPGPGAGLHAADRRLHPADLPAGGRSAGAAGHHPCLNDLLHEHEERQETNERKHSRRSGRPRGSHRSWPHRDGRRDRRRTQSRRSHESDGAVDPRHRLRRGHRVLRALPLAVAAAMNQIDQIARSFGVDWPHLIAQIVSFGIVCALLYRFAYRRVLAMLDERRQRIAEGLANAERIKAELARTEVQRREVIGQANSQATMLIAEARAAVARIHEEETQKAVAAAEQILTGARERSVQDHAQMLAELKREVGRLVVETTAAVAGRVLTADDQRRLAEQTAERVTVQRE